MFEEKEWASIIARLDERYVKKDDCNEARTEAERRIDKIYVDVAVIRTRQNIEISILGAIAVPVLAIAAKLLFGA